jgi:hypothetical protein
VSEVIQLILTLINLDMECLDDLIQFLFVSLEFKGVINILEHAILMNPQLFIEGCDGLFQFCEILLVCALPPKGHVLLNSFLSL